MDRLRSPHTGAPRVNAALAARPRWAVAASPQGKENGPLEQVIDRLTAVCKDNHIRRLQKGACTIEGGFVLSDLLNNYERISDHCSNVAVAIIEVEHNSFDTHKYLNGVKYGNSTFNEIYEAYSEKYVL